MKKFLIAVDHLADYDGSGYEYFALTTDNLTKAKNKTLVNFHKFKKTYLIKILAATKKKDGFRPICNVYGSGRIENIKDEFLDWQVCHNAIHDFEAYVNNN